MMFVFQQEEHGGVPRAEPPYEVGSDRNEQTGAYSDGGGALFWCMCNIPQPYVRV